ncbi:MAG: phage major capsid protein [Rhodocyclaceae bacterium]|nr:phage major capsid protein [Rhodocyclaceae bacterium]
MNKQSLLRAVTLLAVGLFATTAHALGFITADLALAGGLLPMVMGETDFGSLKDLLVKQGSAFEEFKKTNDDLLKAKADGKSVAEFEAKLSKINTDLANLAEIKAAVDSIEKKLSRKSNTDDGDPAKAEHKAAFSKFVRKGMDDGLGELQQKAYNITTDADGGYAVPEELDREILTLLADMSPMREVATVRTIGGADYKKLVNKRGTNGGWVDEDDARPATNSTQLAVLTPFMGEVYAYPQATQQMLDDVFFNAEQFIQDEAAQTFAEMEGAAFITGDGTKKPKGFLAYATAATADASRAFGTLQHVVTGAAGAFAASTPQDVLLTLVYALKKGYRSNASWMLSKDMLAEIRKFKDSEGNYIWRPGLEAGQPDTLLGYGITEAEDMPAKAADSLSVAFGDFKRGYTIVDRIGTRLLRDPYTNKPFVGFYMTKRVGGFMTDSQAIKVLKFAA